MSKTLKLVLSLVLSFSAYAFASDESLTITTYYPSPYGSYRELRAKRIAIGDNYIDGAQYCWEGTCTTLIDDDNNSATPSNVDLIVEGNVGIGTASPTTRFEIKGNNIGGIDHTMGLYADGAGSTAGINFASSKADLDNMDVAMDVVSMGIGTITGHFGDDVTPGDFGICSRKEKDIHFATRQSTGGLPTRMIIKNNGNVGIGTTNPQAKLDVNGEVFIEGVRHPSATEPPYGKNLGFRIKNYLADGYSRIDVEKDPNGERLRIEGPEGVEIRATSGTAGTVLEVQGSLRVTGVKNFVMDYPSNPNKQIVYTSVESPQVLNIVTGSARLNNGLAIIKLPEHFALVTEEEGLSAQVTPTTDYMGCLYIVKKGTKEIVVGEAGHNKGNATFDYLVSGIRKGYKNSAVIRNK